MTWADQIDNSAPEKSEETIETMYYRAQALWHLGEKRTAKEIMTKLSDVQPDYRSASLILRDWEESES
ncbi:MAG: hypothetical protein KDD25_03465 [Bdellovibrionales bacterium]|nr:hypothetical protein [Bdellovibrionales bacterium]